MIEAQRVFVVFLPRGERKSPTAAREGGALVDSRRLVHLDVAA